jgi:hypothetical protein
MKLVLTTVSLLALTLMTTPADAQSKKKPPRVQPLTPFFATMTTGEEQVIATLGPLSLGARCLPDDGEGLIRTQVFATSTVDGWAVSGIFIEGGIDLPAGDALLLQVSVPLAGPGELGRVDGTSLIAPSGEMLATDAIVIGTRVFGVDCLVAGTVLKVTGELAP